MTKMTLKGGLHMHTTLSHDGRMSIKELAAFLRGKGYDYIAISEHSYDVDDQSMSKLVTEAQALSSEEFIIIPGIEFRCRGWTDILGYGVVDTIDSDDPAVVIDHIHNHGGVAVLAHPNVRPIPVDKSWVSMLDGCEIWNIANEGKFLPRSGGIRKFHELARMKPGLLAFTGLDLHGKKGFWSLFAETYVDRRDRQSLLIALKAGQFRSVSPLFSVGSSGEISAIKRLGVIVLRYLLDIIRTIRNIVRP